MRVLNAAQMREADRRTIEDVGIPSIVLMENAGRQVVGAIEATFDDLRRMRVAVLCGRGNNGGDGFVVARMLAERGVSVSVYLLGQRRATSRATRGSISTSCSGSASTSSRSPTRPRGNCTAPTSLGADLIVDALFGTGLRGPLTGLAETIVADVNAVAPAGRVDRPAERAARPTPPRFPARRSTPR